MYEASCPHCWTDQGFSMDFASMGEHVCINCENLFAITGEDTDEGFSFWTEKAD